jgi:hypothetical protein
MSSPFPEDQSADAPILLPDQQEPLPTDDAFQRFEELLDPDTSDADLVVTEDEPPPLGRGWAYDFQQRQFIRSPTAHGPLETHGIATLRVWIEKCLRTARGAYPIYDDDFGIDTPADFFGGPVSQFPDDLLRDRVTDALTRHPQIVDVSDFTFGYDPDEEWIAVNFTVETGQGDQVAFDNVAVTTG